MFSVVLEWQLTGGNEMAKTIMRGTMLRVVLMSCHAQKDVELGYQLVDLRHLPLDAKWRALAGTKR